MDDPMTIIRRHHTAELDQQMLFKITSEASETLGGFHWAMGKNETHTMSWLDDKDGIVAQLSMYGMFVTDYIPRRERYQIAGMCYLLGVPYFNEDDLCELIELELPPEDKCSIN